MDNQAKARLDEIKHKWFPYPDEVKWVIDQLEQALATNARYEIVLKKYAQGRGLTAMRAKEALQSPTEGNSNKGSEE